MERQLLQSAFLIHNYFLPMKNQFLNVPSKRDTQRLCARKRSFYASYFTILFSLGLFLTPSVLSAQTCSGNAVSVFSQTGVNNPTNALGVANAVAAELWDTGDQIVLDLNNVLNNGSTIVVTWRGNTSSTADPIIIAETSSNGTTFTAVAGSPFTLARAATYYTNNITASGNTRYVRFTTTNVFNVDLDALTFTNQTCSPLCGTNTAGTVWRDYNSNGVKSANETEGLSGVTVKAYDCNGNLAEMATTNANGQYTFTSLTPTTTNKYRIEFSNLPPQYKPSLNGAGNKTDIQFITAASCNINFGVNNPNDYCQATPQLIINCYVPGAYNGANAGGHTLVKVGYNFAADKDGNINGTTTGSATDYNIYPTYTPAPPQPTSIADHSAIGSTWGLAYQREQKRLFVASYIKAGAGLGPGESTGMIYQVASPSSAPVTSVFVDLNAVFGANTAGVNPHPKASTPSYENIDDAKTNAAIGKVGLGDIVLSPDGTTLYVVNLADRQLYAIPTSGALNSTTIQRFPIPTAALPTSSGTCAPADMRPFGLGFDNNGVLHVGAVCSGESASTGADVVTNPGSDKLTGYVWKFNGSTYTLALNFPLKFDRDGANGYTTSDVHTSFGLCSSDWEPWSNLVNIVNVGGDYPFQNEPMLSDIVFDEKGEMLLGFRDRFGDCVSPLGGFTSSGDIYKVHNNNGVYTLENNSNVGGITTGGANDLKGPGGGQFFYQDIQGDERVNSGTGGVFVLPGTNQVVSTTVDAVYLNSSGTKLLFASAGGIQIYDNTDGKLSGAYNLYDKNSSANFSKAAGLGAIAAICPPAPIEIGNYVWLDADSDGVQDPCEPSLSNVTVKLYKMDGGTTSLVATTATDANGNYYFKDYDEFGTSGYDTLTAGKMYFVVLEDVNFNKTTMMFANGGKNYLLTSKDATASNGNDQNDSDAAIVASGKTFDGYPANTVTIPTNAAGYVNHTLDFGFKPEPCSMNISNVLVSDCFQQAGASKAMVQITVNWANAIPNDSIKITVGGVNKFIVPTSAGSPQMIQFVVDANGSTGNSITAAFTTSAACSATSTFNAPTACPTDPCAGAGNLGGKAWIDYNMNGVKDAADAQNLAGVTVNIYDCNNNLVGTDVTDANGDWYKSGLAFGGVTDKYRVEFTTPPQYAASFNAANSKTTVQFVSAASCNVDLGVNVPADYCQANPNIVLSCFAVGNPLVGGTTSGIDAIVTFPYLGSVDHTPPPTHEVYANAVGSVWGLAFQKERNEVFSAAFVKRHSGLGSLGTGGIYRTDFNDLARPTVPFLDLSSLTGTLGARDLTGDALTPSRDTFAFNLNGKRGLGDLDISVDGKTLWTVNLNTNELIKIDIANYVSTGTLPTLANVTSFPIPSVVGCPTGDSRPMGLGIKQDKVFVTNTCTGESTQSFDDLKTVVYSFDPATTAFTQVVDLKLNYRRGFINGAFSDPAPSCETWVPWTHQTSDFLKFGGVTSGNDWPCYSQPISSDLIFDNDGTMILNIMDRSGHQMAYANYGPIAPSTTLYNAVTGGDILRFTPQSNGQFIVEAGGVSGTKTSADSNNKEGPGGGEFYSKDGWITPQPWEQHHETAFGALTMVPGTNEIGVTRMDPLSNTLEYGTGGIGWYDNTTGGNSRANGYGVYPLGGFGKGNGLGGMENMCLPAPLQIGNYVWNDTDKDGIQDPCEVPLSMVALSLWKNGVQVATTTTDANGNYAFTGIGAPNETWTATAGTDSILPNTAYEIRISTTQTNIATTNLTVTTANTTANLGNDQNDSDATLTGTDALIAFTTGAAGATNQNLDFGFAPICVPPTITTVAIETPTCTNGVANSNAAVAVRGITGMTKYAYRTNAIDSLWALTATVSTLDSIRVSSLSNPSVSTTYTFRIWGADTTCYNDTTVVLNPKVCSTCSITATFTQSPCNNNGTTAITADDYFTVTVSGVSSTNGGASSKYQVILNGTVLNTGGTAYGTSVTVGGILDFKSDGTTTYNLTVRDLDIPTCVTPVFTTATLSPCSTIGCKPVICIPVTVTRL
jgi:hypothetical protein